VELHEASHPLSINQTEGVDPEPIHHSETARNGTIREHPQVHVRGFWDERGKVPEGVVGGRRLGYLIVRFRLESVDQVRKLDRILDEEHRDVVANEVEDALGRKELAGEAARVARSVG